MTWHNVMKSSKLKPGKNEEEVLPGLAHLQKAPPVFKWKKERKK